MLSLHGVNVRVDCLAGIGVHVRRRLSDRWFGDGEEVVDR